MRLCARRCAEHCGSHADRMLFKYNKNIDIWYNDKSRRHRLGCQREALLRQGSGAPEWRSGGACPGRRKDGVLCEDWQGLHRAGEEPEAQRPGVSCPRHTASPWSLEWRRISHVPGATSWKPDACLVARLTSCVCSLGRRGKDGGGTNGGWTPEGRSQGQGRSDDVISGVGYISGKRARTPLL